MDDPTNNSNDGLNRQRRNLFLISIFLFVYQYADMRVGDLFNIPWTNFKINRPERIVHVLWVAWGYFLYRYYVYFRKQGDKGFRSAFSAALQNRFRKNAKHFLKPHNTEFGIADGDKIVGGDIWYSLPKRGLTVLNYKNLFVHRLDRETGVTASYPLPLSEIELPLEGRREKLLLGYCKARALWYVVVNTPLVTDYFLPFAVAAVPMLLFVYRWWVNHQP